MVDDLRRELIQVIRRCDGITLEQPEINKILNGKYQEVIDDFDKRVVDLDEIALAPNLIGEPELQPQLGLDPLDPNEPKTAHSSLGDYKSEDE